MLLGTKMSKFSCSSDTLLTPCGICVPMNGLDFRIRLAWVAAHVLSPRSGSPRLHASDAFLDVVANLIDPEPLHIPPEFH